MAFEKRLRLFAGPNGSGKSTIISGIKENRYNMGVYLNADDLEKELNKTSSIDLSAYELQNITKDDFSSFCNHHTLLEKARLNGYNIDLSCENNTIRSRANESNSYEASIIISFIVNKLLEKGRKFSFESVMSHESKIQLLRKAKENGYKNYLYYVCTEDVQINLNRVAARVKMGGHGVDREKVIKRYYESLNLLADAVKLTYRSYIFDNSGCSSKLILEIDTEKEQDNTKFHHDYIPNWLSTYLIDKLS
ncbi:hypothetical protein [Viscerimonas tarda]